MFGVNKVLVNLLVTYFYRKLNSAELTSKMLSYHPKQTGERPLCVAEWGLFISFQLIHI